MIFRENESCFECFFISILHQSEKKKEQDIHRYLLVFDYTSLNRILSKDLEK